MITEVKFYLEKRKEKATGKIITENVPILLFIALMAKDSNILPATEQVPINGMALICALKEALKRRPT